MYANAKISVTELRRQLYLLEESCMQEETDMNIIFDEIHAIIDDLVTEEKSREKDR